MSLWLIVLIGLVVFLIALLVLGADPPPSD
jgi:hypothetical protein